MGAIVASELLRWFTGLDEGWLISYLVRSTRVYRNRESARTRILYTSSDCHSSPWPLRVPTPFSEHERRTAFLLQFWTRKCTAFVCLDALFDLSERYVGCAVTGPHRGARSLKIKTSHRITPTPEFGRRGKKKEKK